MTQTVIHQVFSTGYGQLKIAVHKSVERPVDNHVDTVGKSATVWRLKQIAQGSGKSNS